MGKKEVPLKLSLPSERNATAELLIVHQTFGLGLCPLGIVWGGGGPVGQSSVETCLPDV